MGKRGETVKKIRAALETSGIEFIDENGGGAGVRWRARSLAQSRKGAANDTVPRFEWGDEIKERTVEALQRTRTLEASGVEFSSPMMISLVSASPRPLQRAPRSPPARPTVAPEAVRGKTAKATEKKR